MRPKTRDLPDDQAALVVAWCALRVVPGGIWRDEALRALRSAMTEQARLRCSRFERRFEREQAAQGKV